MRTLLAAAALAAAFVVPAVAFAKSETHDTLARTYDTLTCQFRGQPTMTFFLGYDPTPDQPAEDGGNSWEISGFKLGNAAPIRGWSGREAVGATVNGREYLIEDRGPRLVDGSVLLSMTWKATLSINGGRRVKGKCQREFN